MKKGFPELAQKTLNSEKDCPLTSVIKTLKKYESAKIALGSRKLFESCIKLGPHMPIKEEILSHILTEISRVQNEPIWISRLDLEYAYGQLNLSEETSGQCNFAVTGGKLTGEFRFRKIFIQGLSDIPTIFQEEKTKD